MLSESIRLQYADTICRSSSFSAVRPHLAGTRAKSSEVAMPLDEFVAEALTLFETKPEAREIQVERVKFLRYGEARGDYDQVVATLNASDPHGK